MAMYLKKLALFAGMHLLTDRCVCSKVFIIKSVIELNSPGIFAQFYQFLPIQYESKPMEITICLR